jgi:hypothetical protein
MENVKIGFVYDFECIGVDGEVRWTAREENLIPDVGRDYILNAALTGGSQLSTWYIGLYENTHVPVVSDTMTSLLADAGEITTYTSAGSLRLQLQAGALSAGVYSNVATKAEFVFTANKSVRGGFIASSAAQGATSGTLLSAVYNSSAKAVNAGETLRVTAGLSLTTV